MQVVYSSIPDMITSHISKSQACVKYLHVGTLKISFRYRFFLFRLGFMHLLHFILFMNLFLPFSFLSIMVKKGIHWNQSFLWSFFLTYCVPFHWSIFKEGTELRIPFHISVCVYIYIHTHIYIYVCMYF